VDLLWFYGIIKRHGTISIRLSSSRLAVWKATGSRYLDAWRVDEMDFFCCILTVLHGYSQPSIKNVRNFLNFFVSKCTLTSLYEWIMKLFRNLIVISLWFMYLLNFIGYRILVKYLIMPDKCYTGNCKATREDYNQGTPGKEIARGKFGQRDCRHLHCWICWYIECSSPLILHSSYRC